MSTIISTASYAGTECDDYIVSQLKKYPYDHAVISPSQCWENDLLCRLADFFTVDKEKEEINNKNLVLRAYLFIERGILLDDVEMGAYILKLELGHENNPDYHLDIYNAFSNTSICVKEDSKLRLMTMSEINKTIEDSRK